MDRDRHYPERNRAGNLLAVWDGAIALTVAVDRLAGGSISRNLRDSVVDTVDLLRRDPRSPLADRPLATDRLQSLAQAWERQARLLEAARERLVVRLSAGELAALGFARRTGDDRPARLLVITRRDWSDNPVVDWEAETVSVGKMTVAYVRVVDLSGRPERVLPR